MKVTGLFAGIGGFEVGFRSGNIEANLLVEIDPAARAVLKRWFPDTELAGDIRALRDLPLDTDIVCAGFPCQDLSSVGQKGGIHGRQSSLVDEVFRLLRRRRVEWVIIENVHFMLHLNGGAAMQRITGRLEKLGYAWAYRTIDAIAFGHPQRRRRVFVVASQNHDPRHVLLSEDKGIPPAQYPSPEIPLGFYWTEGTRALGLAVDAVPPLKGGSGLGIPSPPAILHPDGLVITPDLRDAERLQGFKADWTRPAEALGRPSLRWRLVGNAVNVPVAKWLARQIATPNQCYDDSADTAQAPTERWSDAAWSLVPGQRYRSAVSHFPKAISSRGLLAFLRHPGTPLSERAASGFLKRAQKGSLRFPEHFLSTIERHIAHVTCGEA